ncbi:hypothetical protein [Sphingobacterium siyangense]|uniref:hypothetical protein n=1 Tax=Sphingobacterium siyangense TaxID=459529 RepID=UPI003DA41F2C
MRISKVNKGNITINNKNKYIIVLTGLTGRIRIKTQRRLHKATVTRINPVGAKPRYDNDTERHEARKLSKKNCYAKTKKTYKRDTDKSLTDTLRKADIVQATKDFYSKHYRFNYLLTPQYFFSLDKYDSKRIIDAEMYSYVIQQDKYQRQHSYTKNDCIKKVNYILSRLKKNGKLIYDNYYYVIHKSHITNTYHPHILLNVIDESIKNVHTFLHNRAVGYMKKYQKKLTVKLYDIENMLGYLNEEYKRNNKEQLNIVYCDCNISRHSNRMVTQRDLDEDLQHGLNTYTHPQTLKKLNKYGVQYKTA